MASKKKDFYGKEVTDAIKKACDKLGVPQEQLEIEVVETGSTGIFGLIRKKAHIRAYIKQSEKTGGKQPSKKSTIEDSEHGEDKKATKKREEDSRPPQVATSQAEPEKEEAFPPEKTPEPKQASEDQSADGGEKPGKKPDEKPDEKPRETVKESVVEEEDEEQGEELSEEVVDLVKEELDAILKLMGYPSDIEIQPHGSSLTCRIADNHEEVLTGEDGKTLDSIQYLLRKIVARKVPNRLRLTVDVGNYRSKRLDELKERAAELAAKVKEDGKTQVIAALSPSERRVIHMSLQDDKEIRSRSVGDGLFKKILIYKPGKGGKGGGRKRNNTRGRRNSNNRRKNS